MKRRGALRESRLAQMAVGASMLAVPASAAALVEAPHEASGQSQQAADQPPGAIEASVRSRRVPYGRDVVVTGRAPSADAGHTVGLDYAPAGSPDWRQISSTTVHPDGAFRLAAALQHSGSVKVTDTASPSSSSTVPLAADASGSAATSSAPLRVEVEAAIRVPARAINVLSSEMVHLRGKLLGGVAHRRVQLQGRRGGHWRTLSVARTGPRGGFDIRYEPSGIGRHVLRVRFAGDATNAGVARRTGTLTVYEQTAASWYDDGGSTACGFHAYYGVANLSLPCGSKVSFIYGGRAVTAVVDDRGPYVGGRVWDLNQNVAAALGFDGVQNVWSSE